MTSQTSIVPEEEFIFRRIHRNHVELGPPPTIAFTGFRPTPEDTAGLSIFRENLVSAAEVASAGRKPGEYYIARIQVARLRELGLTIKPDELAEGPPGHALIPELSLDSCRREKVRLREVQVRLAELATQNIVHWPVSE